MKSCMCRSDCLPKVPGSKSPTSRISTPLNRYSFSLSERRLGAGCGQAVARGAPHALADDLALETDDALTADPVQVDWFPARRWPTKPLRPVTS
jgi:hypothetical protein